VLYAQNPSNATRERRSMSAREGLTAITPVVYVGLASLAFAVGGIFMKLSEGLTRWPSSLAVFVLFITGAALNTLAMTRGDLGVVYVLVLGLEAVLAFGFGVAFFHEAVTPMRVLAVSLIVAGMACLR
jgi:multidrug transporter EmrE-like cation transporter